MADSDSELRIKAVIDSTDADSGAAQVAGDLDQIKDKTGDVAEAQERLAGKSKEAGGNLDAAALSNLRSVHHLLSGFFELQEGGVAAIGGLAAEGRVATEVFEGMLGPLALPLLVATTITMQAVPMLERFWEGQKRQIADGEKGADDFTQAWKEASTEIASALGQILSAQQAVTQSNKDDLAAIKEKAGLQDKQAKSDEKAAIETLRSGYIQAEQNPDLTEAQRKQLKDKFEAGKKDIEEQTTVNSAQADRTAKAREYGVLERTQYDQRQQVQTNQQTLDELQAIQQKAHDTIDGLGLSVDKDGKITNAQGQNETDRLRQEAEKYKQNYERVERVGGYSPEEQAHAKKLMDDAKKNYQDMLAVGQNYNLGDAIKEAQKNLDDSTKALAETVSKIPTALTEWSQATQNADLAQGDAIQNKQQQIIDQNLQARAQADKDKYDIEKANLEAQRKGLETSEDNPALSDDQKAQIKAQIDGLDAKLAQLQIDNAFILNLTDAQKIGLRSDIKNDNQKAGFDLAAGQKKTDAEAEEADKKATQEQLQSVRGQIEGTGNKELIQEAHRIMQTVLDKHAELVELQTLFAQAAAGRFQQIDHAHADLKATVERMKH